MPASLQSWWDRCHGEGSAVLGEAALEEAAPGAAGMRAAGAAGVAERFGWNPGPLAWTGRAWVGPGTRGAGFGASGEDQDPSGSRRGEGTTPTARQGPASRRGLASRLGLGLSGLGLSGLGLSGLGLSGLGAGGCGARRNHPAGGATPGQEASSAAASSAAFPLAAGLAGAGLAGAGLGGVPGNRRPAAGGVPEPTGPAARTKGALGFPDHPSGTGRCAVDLPLASSHYYDSHSTGHFLYSSQTPVRAHFWQNAIVCRSSHFLVHTGWPAV